MKTKEELAKSIENICKNTKRIHEKSDSIDWIELASWKVASFMIAQLELPEGRDLRSELIDFANYITRSDCPYAICYGEVDRFVTSEDNFSCFDIVDEYLRVKNNLNK